MNTHAEKTTWTLPASSQERQSGANEVAQDHAVCEPTFQFVRGRPGAATQGRLEKMANSSARALQLKALQEMANNRPRANDGAQLQAMTNNNRAHKQQTVQKRENKTGLPDHLKTGVETLSGIALDDVKVHYNSSQPTQFNAHAYAQGTDIHLAPGKENHLPHEAWHVVQQKQGRVKPIKQFKSVALNDDSSLEEEADIMGTMAMKASPPESYSQLKSVGVGITAIQRKKYAELKDFEKASVDAEVDKTYQEKAMAFEQLLGKKFAVANESEEIANKMLAIVRRIVDAYHSNTRTWFETKGSVYEREFRFVEGDKYFGAFKMTGANIERIFESLEPLKPNQPLRKKLKVIYNSVRNNNMAKWLKIASDGMDGLESEVVHFANGVRGKRLDDATHQETIKTGFAQESGLRKILTDNPSVHNRVKAASNKEKEEVRTHGFFGPKTRRIHLSAPDAFSSIARGTPTEAAKMDAANKDRLYSQNRGVPLSKQQTITNADIPDLTDEEILLIKQRRGENVGSSLSTGARNAFKANPGDKIDWEQGREAIRVMFNSKVEKDAESLRARLEAGISGSTGMMFAAAKNLGINSSSDLKKLRLAMLGWMLPNHDHSFYEIMMAADFQGVPFIADPTHPGKQYEEAQNFDPADVHQLKNLLTENEFPRYFLSEAYKDTLADLIKQASYLDTIPKPGVADPSLSPEEATKKRYRAYVTGLGLRVADVDTLDERGLLEIITLNEYISALSFADETVADTAKAREAKAVNKLKLHQLRTQPAYHYLQHTYAVHTELWLAELLTQLGKPLTIDHTGLLTGDAAKLPSANADINARKALLSSHGVPAYLLDDIPEHLINDLVSLNTIIDQLGLDGAKGVKHDDNKDKYKNILETSFWERLINSCGVRKAEMLIAFIIRHKYGTFIYKSILDPAAVTPEALAMQGLGIPDKMVRVLLLDPDGKKLIQNLDNAISAISAKPVIERIPSLKLLAGNHMTLKNFIDAKTGLNSFDIIVAAIAAKKNIDLEGDRHLRTLGRTASALNTSNDIVSPDQAKSGFGNFSLESAKTTLEDNLRTEGKVLAGTPFQGLTDVEVASINAYSKLGGMGSWQGVLWKPDTTNANAGDKLVKLAPKIQAAVAGLRKLPPYAGPVYNAQRSDLKDKPEIAMRVFATGTVHRQDNFLSTSVSVADSFIPKAEYGVAWVIGPGHHGKNIAPLSTNYGEKEVLFAPGSSFIVTKIEDKTASADPADYKKVWVWVEEV
jgi:hypothetical protein